MSTLKTSCPHCEKTLKVQGRHVGKVVKCPSCSERFEVANLRTGGVSVEQLQGTESLEETASGGAAETAEESESVSLPDLAKAAAEEATLERLGRFEVKQLLGEGGFGRVYRAYDPQLDRFVALKVPTFGASDKQRVKRFLTEAKAAAQLRHPHIVPTFDSGQAGRKLYIASQFIDGQALNDRIRNGKVEPPDAARLIAKIADAVHYANEQGIVHRDIKPHNVMLDKKNEPQLMDFGLAKRVDEESTMTVDGSLMGTPAYMSPEQARGDHQNVGPASDQYSVGVMLYELLTGEKPFSGAPHSVIKKVIDEEPRSVQARDPKVSSDLDAICQKAMAKDVNRRYGSCGELANDLRAWLEGRPTTARVPGPVERLNFWVKRNPVIAGLSSLLTLSLLAGAAISIWFAIDANNQKALAEQEATNARNAEADVVVERDAAEDARKNAVAEADKARKAEQEATEAKDEAFAARDQADEALAKSNHALATAWIDAHRGMDAAEVLSRTPHKHRHFEWYLARGWAEGGYMTLPIPSAAISPDARLVADPSVPGSVILRNADTGEEIGRAELPNGEAGRELRFNESGTMLAASTGAQIHFIDIAKMEVVKSKPEPLRLDEYARLRIDPTFDPEFAFNDEECVFSDNRILQVRNQKTGEVIAKFDLPPSDYTYCPPARSNDGNLIATGAKGYLTLICSVDEQKVVGVLGGELLTPDESVSGYSTLREVDFSPDASLVVTCHGDNVVRVWDVASLKLICSRKINWLSSVKFSPDGSLIAAETAQGVVHLISAENGADVRVIGAYGFLDYSSDGRRIFQRTRDEVIVWDLALGRESSVIVTARDASNTNSVPWIRDMQLSPDGRTIAVCNGTNDITLIDTNTQLEIATLAGHTYRPISLAWHPNGDRLASGGYDATIRIWDMKTLQCIRVIEKADSFFRHEDSGRGSSPASPNVCFTSNGKILVSAGSDRIVRIWNAETGELIKSMEGHKEPINDVTISPDDTVVATGSEDGSVHLWNLETGERIGLIENLPAVKLVQFGPKGEFLFTAGANGPDGTIRRWNVADQELVRELYGHTAPVWSFAFTPDGSRMASSSYDYSVRLWDTISGDEVAQLLGHEMLVKSVAFSPAGDKLYSASFDATIRVWDGSQHRGFFDLELGGQPFCISPNDRWVAGATPDGSVAIWSAENGSMMHRLPSRCSAPAMFLSDGKTLIFPTPENTLSFWDTASWSLIREFDIPAHNWLAGLSADGKKVYLREEVPFGGAFEDPADAGPESEYTVWNLADGTMLSKIDQLPEDSELGKDVTSDGSRQLQFKSRNGYGRLRKPQYETASETLTYRKIRAAFNPTWHRKQAEQSEVNANHFAAMFHRALLLNHSTDSVETYIDFQVAKENYLSGRTDEDPWLPEHVRTALVVEPPSGLPAAIDAAKAALLNPAATANSGDLTLLKLNAQKEPTSDNNSLVGLALYRRKKYQQAVTFVAQSAGVMAAEQNAMRNAVLALCYHKLGDTDSAARYRAQFDQHVDYDNPVLFGLRGEIQWAFEADRMIKLNREVALATLEYGGTVKVDPGTGRSWSCTSPDKLPRDPFVVKLLDFGSKQIPADLLPLCKGLTGLEDLYLTRTDVSDEHLRMCPTLRSVRRIRLISCDQISDDALVHLEKFPETTSLNLAGTRITDAAVTSILQLRELEGLQLMRTRITDEGARELSKLSKLRSLGLKGTQVSESVVLQLRAALPNCTIDWEP